MAECYLEETRTRSPPPQQWRSRLEFGNLTFSPEYTARTLTLWPLEQHIVRTEEEERQREIEEELEKAKKAREDLRKLIESMESRKAALRIATNNSKILEDNDDDENERLIESELEAAKKLSHEVHNLARSMKLAPVKNWLDDSPVPQHSSVNQNGQVEVSLQTEMEKRKKMEAETVASERLKKLKELRAELVRKNDFLCLEEAKKVVAQKSDQSMTGRGRSLLPAKKGIQGKIEQKREQEIVPSLSQDEKGEIVPDLTQDKKDEIVPNLSHNTTKPVDEKTTVPNLSQKEKNPTVTAGEKIVQNLSQEKKEPLNYQKMVPNLNQENRKPVNGQIFGRTERPRVETMTRSVVQKTEGRRMQTEIIINEQVPMTSLRGANRTVVPTYQQRNERKKAAMPCCLRFLLIVMVLFFGGLFLFLVWR